MSHPKEVCIGNSLPWLGENKGPCTKSNVRSDFSWLWGKFTSGRDELELISTDGKLQTWKYFEDHNDDAMGGTDTTTTEVYDLKNNEE